jgi:GAF domain-containing protein
MMTLPHEPKALRKIITAQQHYLESVHETTIGLIQHHGLDDLLEMILAKAGILAGTPDAFLYIHDPHSDELIMKLGQGVYTDIVGVRVKPGQGLAGQVYDTGEAVIIDDYATWSQRISHPLYDKLHSAIGIPLKSKAATVGVIGLGSFDPTKPFDHNDLYNMKRFAELASVALENARLNTDLQRELNERKKAEKALRTLNAELEQRVAERTLTLEKAFSKINQLQGIVPICCTCKKIRDDKGYWNLLEAYIEKHSDASFSHGICPECAKKYYPDLDLYDEEDI